MSNYYKIVGGCHKCQRRGVFQLTQDKQDGWHCPYKDQDCEGQLEPSSWAMKNIKLIRLGSVVAIIIFLIAYLLIGGGNAELEKDLKIIDTDIQTFQGSVRKLPQNTGAVNPYQSLWEDRILSSIKTLKTYPNEDIYFNMEKLKELENELALDLKKRKKEDIPEFDPPKTLAKYSKLKNEGRGIRNRLGGVKSRATLAEAQGILVRSKRSDKKLKEALKELTKKSKLIGGNQQASSESIMKSSIAALEQAQKRVTERKKELAQEISDAAEATRLARLAEIETAKKRSEAEKERLWNAAKPNVTVIVNNSIRKSLISKLALGYVSSNGQSSQTLEKGGVFRYTSAHATIEVKDSSDGLRNEAKTMLVNVKSNDDSPPPNASIIALDAMVAVVHLDNSTYQMTSQQLSEVLAGQLTSWSKLGGTAGLIKLYAPLFGSSNFSVIDGEVTNLLQNNSKAVKTTAVIPAISQNSSALGIAAFHSSGNLKRVAIDGVKPTPSSISSENYRYCKRVYAQLPDSQDKELKDFLKFIKSDKGQKIVSDAGYIDLRVQVGKPVPASSWPIIQSATGWEVLSAFRLNTNLRFATGESSLDVKATADITRIQHVLKLHLSGKKKALIIGFTDSVGSSEFNDRLSKERSKKISDQLINSVSGSGSLKSIGLGASLPISDNHTEIGKSKNRRVEVWIVEIK